MVSCFFSKIDIRIILTFRSMRFKLVVFALFIVSFASSAQQKVLQMEEIWDGTFQTKSLHRLHSLKNGKEYTVMGFDADRNRTIDVYSYESGEKVRSLLNTKRSEEHTSELQSLFD